MYTLDMKAIRDNWMRGQSKKKSRVKLKIRSTCYPDVTDFNEAAERRLREMHRILYQPDL